MGTEHVVITGGLGFIGTHLADAYLERGTRVTLIDSMITAVSDGTEYQDQGCTIIESDLLDYLGAGGTFGDATRVVHAASLVGPAGILPFAGRIGAELVQATALVIEECLRLDVPLLVFSSAEVYGRSGLLAEGDDIRVPAHYNARIEYAIAKLLNEAITVNRKADGLNAIAVRPFNVTGPRQSSAAGFVMPTFVQQALAGEPLTVFHTGEQERAFLSVRDLSRFVVEFMDAAVAGPSDVYNLGNPENRTTITGLAQRVQELTGGSSSISLVDARTIHGPTYEEAESFQKLPQQGAAHELGWRAEVGLDELILETIAYYSTREDSRTRSGLRATA